MTPDPVVITVLWACLQVMCMIDLAGPCPEEFIAGHEVVLVQSNVDKSCVEIWRKPEPIDWTHTCLPCLNMEGCCSPTDYTVPGPGGSDE